MTWASWAHETDGRYTRFGTIDYLRYASPDRSAVPVTFIEDEDGSFFGWLDTGASELTLVHRKVFFRIQSGDGFEGAVKQGLGRVVSLRAEPRNEGAVL